jgi:hypothetical protein
MSTFLDDIEKLAADVAKEALDSKTLQEKMDALKLLQPYYAILKKGKGASSDDADDEPTMDDIRRGLRVVVQEPADGGVKATGRRNRNSG